MKNLFREFRPTILFLVKFIGIYIVGNVLYGLYVTKYYPQPDPATQWVTGQTTLILKILGWDASSADNTLQPTTIILNSGSEIVSVYEGCNGINVILIFIGFLVAFGPLRKSMFWFVPMGVGILHLSNLVRIASLFMVALYFPGSLYFIHKYLFTAALFVVVFILWIWWIRKYGTREA